MNKKELVDTATVEIKDIRAKTGMSRKKFYETFEIPERTLQAWEEGDRKPPKYVVNLLKMAVEKYLEEKENVTMKKYYMYCLKGESDLQAICTTAFNTAEEAAQEAKEKGYTNEETEICEIEEDGDVIVTGIISLDDALNG